MTQGTFIHGTDGTRARLRFEAGWWVAEATDLGLRPGTVYGRGRTQDEAMAFLRVSQRLHGYVPEKIRPAERAPNA